MILAIVMLVAGLYLVILGRTGLRGKWSLKGARARITGLVLLAPMLLTLCVSVVSVALNREISDLASAALNASAFSAMWIALAYANLHIVSRGKRVRGGCLTIWLVIVAAGAMLGLWMVWQLNPSVLAWPFIASGVVAVFQVISVIGVWRWRKWSVFGLFASLALGAASALTQGSPVLVVLTSFLGSAVTLYLLVKPKWRFFDSQDAVPQVSEQELAVRSEDEEGSGEHQAARAEDHFVDAER
jgi:hypothetical protein